MNTNLFKEAIAEADAIKKMAIENAKASLNEAFDSKVKAMLAARLEEEAEDLEEEYDEKDEAAELDEKKHEKEVEEQDEAAELDEKKDDKEGDDEGYGMEEADHDKKEEADEAFDLDAILAELEKVDEEEEVMEKKEVEDKPKEEESEEGSEEESEEGEEVDEEIDIAALLAEMKDEEDHDDDHDKKSVDEEKQEDDESYVAEADKDKGILVSLLAPILKSVGASQEVIDKLHAKAKELSQAMANAGVGLTEKKEEVEELQEIKRQAAELTQKVNETNLINAKLLYLNKILRKYNLSEQQKIKVISAFDKAETAKEAKIVHESLDHAFSVKNDNVKAGLKESIGFASSAAGTSTKRVITESVISDVDKQVNRWQKLAGIIK